MVRLITSKQPIDLTGEPIASEQSLLRTAHRRVTTTPRCVKLTERQKYAKLERVGGRNQQFMANSPEEAGRNFARLVADAADEHEFAERQQFSDDIETNVGFVGRISTVVHVTLSAHS